LKTISFDQRCEDTLEMGIQRDAALFVLNKWDRVESKEKEVVVKKVVEDAKKIWSPRISLDRFVKLDSLGAFRAFDILSSLCAL